MGWFSGNAKYVAERQKKRIKESEGLYSEAEAMHEETRGKQLGALDSAFERQMGESVSGLAEMRQGIADREKRALDRVAAVTGNNPLAIARAKQGFADESQIMAGYGGFADQRSNLLQARLGDELAIETNYLQQMSQTKMGRANMLASIQEHVDEGWGKTLAGIGGNILGFKLFGS